MTVGRTAPVTPARVGMTTLLSLLAGRGAFRLAFQAANLSLLAVWGSAVFGPYAAALGTMVWLVFVGSAVEKAVLKTMPRARLARADLARAGLVLAAVPLVVTLAALLPATVLAPGSRTVLYLLAATWNTATGLLFLLAALHRLDGRPVGDSRTFFVLGLCIAASLAAGWSFGFGPNRQLAMMDAVALALLVTTTRGLPGPWRAVRRLPRRRAVVRILARTTWLLGVYDLAAAVSVSMLYLVLTLTGRGAQADLLFLALLGSGVAGSLLLYLLRVAAPGASARLRGAVGAAAGRRSCIATRSTAA